MPTREELLQIANQKMAEAAVQQISNEYQSNTQLAYEAAAAGKYDDAAYHLREAKKLEDEARPYLQAAHQQQQSQYTQAEQQLMTDYPEEVRRNWSTAQAAANNLIMSKRKADPEADLLAYRNSREYIAGIAHAVGILNSDLTESNELTSPNEALRACQSKYGSISVDEYNENAKRLAELKKYGFYPMSQA
jgi:hypothetical protein